MPVRPPHTLSVLVSGGLLAVTVPATARPRIDGCNARFLASGGHLTPAPAAVPAFDAIVPRDQRTQVGNGLCDAWPVRGGVTTEDEMFIWLGAFYVAP